MDKISLILLFITAGLDGISGETCKQQLEEIKDVTKGVVAILDSQLDKLSKISDSDDNLNAAKIAFYARLIHGVSLGNKQTVVFDDVVTNHGHAYDKNTGLFTAPRNGTYVFASAFLSQGGSVHLKMMKNNVEVARGQGYPDNASTGSMAVVVDLNTGDIVKLRHWEGLGHEKIFGERRSSFSGYIL